MHAEQFAPDHLRLDDRGDASRGQVLHYGGAVLELDDTQAALLSARVGELCRRRRTALHTVYGKPAGETSRVAVQVALGHGIPFALVPVSCADAR